MTLKVKKMRENAMLPTRESAEAAGVDLYACDGKENFGEEIGEKLYLINPNESVMIPTGIACEFPEGYFGAMIPRSSVGAKRNLVLANTLGVLDHDYRGEIMMVFRNEGDKPQIIKPGERLAQMILLPYIKYDTVEVDELSETERGNGGFGSTGKF